MLLIPRTGCTGKNRSISAGNATSAGLLLLTHGERIMNGLPRVL